jgi:hypothetical protein
LANSTSRRALLFLDGGVEAVEVGKLRHVAEHARHVAPDGLHGRVEFGLAAARDEHVRAFGHEALRGGQADAAGAAGDEGDLVVELEGHDGFLDVCREAALSMERSLGATPSRTKVPRGTSLFTNHQ